MNKPEVWLQFGAHPGDNAQIAALGDLLRDNLGWKVKSPDIDDMRSSIWPDFLIGAGYRNVSTALEIKERSDGKTKLLRIGRPRLSYDLFDLIITTRQYGLIPSKNVVLLSVPLSDKKNADRSLKLTQGLDLPRPWYVMVVGGPTKTNKFRKEDIEDFLERSFAKIRKANGSALIITSPRTPDKLRAMLEKGGADWPPHKAWFWGKNMPNPYAELLEQCDYVISTGDSASIAADAVSLGKPLFLASPTPQKNRYLRDALWNNRARRVNEKRRVFWDKLIDYGVTRGILVPHRSMKWFHDHLKKVGLAASLDDEEAPVPDQQIIENEIKNLLQRIETLFR